MDQVSQLYALCQCEKYDFVALRDMLTSRGECTSNRNVLHVPRPGEDIFLFDYGIVIFWGTSPHNRQEFLRLIEPHARGLIDTLISDEFTYTLAAELLAIKNDHIQLPGDNPMTRLALSHGIAQSTKLAQFEELVQKTISDTAYIPRNIAETGASRLGRKETAKLRGRLFITKNDIMLHYDLLDVPEFFWENPEYGTEYATVADYLEVRQRVEVLGKKLETIHELFDMMAEEQKHKHSSLLEWIIIWLIAIDIVVIMVHDIFKWV
jgi:uncharacterized Rmd1/YagE family protein